MEEIKNNKIIQVLKWIFIIVSILFLGYATYTMRGLYLDGVFFIVTLLQNISNNFFKIEFDVTHTRIFNAAFTQIPIYISGFLLGIKNKILLSQIYSFFVFVSPLLFLIINYFLTKRTKRIDLLFWSIFSYSLLLLPFSIFALTEIYFGVIQNFILYNYLSSNINYNKKDICLIILLIVIMFSTHEYILFVGPLFFIASLFYAKKEENKKNKIIKYGIGIGSLCSALYVFCFMLKTPGESDEILRFLEEGYNFAPELLNLNSLITIGTLILLITYLFIKKEIKIVGISVIFLIFIGLFTKLMLTTTQSIHPMWEQHLRTIPCWAIPLIFLCILIFDISKKEISSIKIQNLICIILLAGITQTSWQIVSTYYWDKNIQYMKSELANHNNLLYIPTEHPDMGSFHNEELRRYIWHGVYAATSIIFSDTYEIKTLLSHYDDTSDKGNYSFREALYVPSEPKDMIVIPYGVMVKQKNEFWDLTNCAKALDEYNKEHNIKTNDTI